MFTPGTVYRRVELHEQYGGQRYSGISTLSQHPMIWLFSGEQGALYGYHDGFRDDGTYWYTGEGQVGDMKMAKGNAAIRDHLSLGKSLHLFDYVSTGHVRYVGEASYTGHHTQVAADRNGAPRNAIVFELALSYADDEPAEVHSAVLAQPKQTSLWKQPLDAVRGLAVHRPPDHATPVQRKVNAYTRSQAVRVYVLRRANGCCEGCESPAPFTTKDGRPYLEAHHLRRRADGGPDHPRWVIALCPNCHRRVHHGDDGAAYNFTLVGRVGAIESSYSTTASIPAPLVA